MTRLLLLSSEFPPGPGGIGTHACQLATYMARAGWQVRVLTFQDYADEQEVRAANRAQPFEIERWLRPERRLVDIASRWRNLREALQSWKPDVLLATGDRQVWLAALAQQSSRRVPWCAVWHGFTPVHVLEKQITRWAFQQADLTIAVSRYSLERLVRLGTQPRRSAVITNGADPQRCYPDPQAGRRLRESLGLEDALVLLTVGHVTERKGQDIVIRALPEILESVPNVHYLVAGLPTRREALEGLACELGVGRHVHLLGRVDAAQLQAAYNACDVFVLTSRHSANGEFEGYGIVVAEAALCGKPAVVAGNSGLVEAVVDGQTGLVVPENHPAATAQALTGLLQDACQRSQMGEQALRRALREQTWNACMEHYRQALCSLLERGS